MCGLQDHHILARKFMDRWMVKALGVGLCKRPLSRLEDPQRRPNFMRQLTLGALAWQVGRLPLPLQESYPGILRLASGRSARMPMHAAWSLPPCALRSNSEPN